MHEDLLFEINEHIASITLNRPDKLNAFTGYMIDAWVSALERCRDDPDIRVIVMTGAGRAFCSGADVGDMQRRAELSPAEHKANLERLQRIPLLLDRLDKPVIAALPGIAAGAGLDFALAADVRFAAESARLSEIYIRRGLVPGSGGAHLLTRLVGTAKALELIWTGDMIDAGEAERLGIVNRVFPDDLLMTETYKFASRLAEAPELAVRLIKRAVYESARADLRTSLDLISSHLGIIRGTPEHREAVTAFLEKQKRRTDGT